MRKCLAFVFLLPILGMPHLSLASGTVSLFAKPYVVRSNFIQPAKIPLPVREYADYTTTPSTPAGCELYWFGSPPGDTIGCTRYDRQWNFPPQKRIIFDPKTGCTHTLWIHSLDATVTAPNRHMFYNCKTGGSWAFGQELLGGTPVQEASKDGYGDLDVDTAGLAVVSLHRVIGSLAQSAVYTDQVEPGMGSFKKLNDFPTAPGDQQTIWPMVAVDSKNNMVIVAHADSTIGQSSDYDKCWYSYSKDGGKSWSSWAVVDTFSLPIYNVFASKKSEKICICWGKAFQEADLWNGHPLYMESENGGENWGPVVDALSTIPTPSNKTYTFSTMKHSPFNVYGIYDSDDNIQLVADASVGTTQKGAYYSGIACVIWHYSSATGLHTVATQPAPYYLLWTAAFEYPYYGQVMAKPVISEDPTNKWLYVAWVEFPYDTVGPAGYEAGEIYITYSFNGGETWAPKLNLTMTPPECEVFATMAPVTNDTVRIFYEYDNSGYDGLVQDPQVMDTINPMMYLELPVTRGDVEAVDITSPEADTIIDDTLWIVIDSGATYSPTALYTNKGTTPISFQTKFEACQYVAFLLGDAPDTLIAPRQLYYDIKNIDNLAPGETTIVHFKPWTTDLGLPSKTVWVSLSAYATCLVDTNLSNNSVGIGIEETPTPKSIFTVESYPNPAARNVNIKYSVPQTSYVSLKVYDITGKLVSTLVDKTCKAGTYTTNWNGKTSDGRTAPNGIYFYRLCAGSYSATKKIVLLK